MAVKRKPTIANAALAQEKEWGVPVWRQKQGYPKKSDSIDRWKWEFLRRTEEYRNDWERACDTEQTPTAEDAPRRGFLVQKPFNKAALQRKYRMTHAKAPTVSYDKLPKSFAFDRMPESSTGGNIVYPQEEVPGFAKKKQKKAANKIDFGKVTSAFPDPTPSNWYEMRVWVEYDLGYSLDTQLERAEDALFDAQKKLKVFMAALGTSNDPDDYSKQEVGVRKERGADRKNDFKEMEKLLRIIDAKRSTVRNNKIVQELDRLGFDHMDDSTVSKNYKTALSFWKEL